MSTALNTGENQRVLWLLCIMDNPQENGQMLTVPVLKARNSNTVYITRENFNHYLAGELRGQAMLAGFAIAMFGEEPLLLKEISQEDHDNILEDYAREEHRALSRSEKIGRVLGL